MSWLILVKLAINLGIASYWVRTSPALALMFAGFAIADAGSWWVCLTKL